MDTDTIDTTQTTWQTSLAAEKQKPYFQKILQFLKDEKAHGKIIYPQQSDIFNAIRFTPLAETKVVILGQDPYHGPNQAYGLCFSVRPGVPAPPSLQNIFKELNSDLQVPTPNHGCLEKWARQGVLLLNTVLTVEAGKAHSHAKIGWEIFTDKVIQILDAEQQDLIFLLWGSHAQSKQNLIDPRKHYIIKAPHPSPLSAHRGFLGCKHFSKTNELLKKFGKPPIDWRV